MHVFLPKIHVLYGLSQIIVRSFDTRAKNFNKPVFFIKTCKGKFDWEWVV